MAYYSTDVQLTNFMSHFFQLKVSGLLVIMEQELPIFFKLLQSQFFLSFMCNAVKGGIWLKIKPIIPLFMLGVHLDIKLTHDMPRCWFTVVIIKL